MTIENNTSDALLDEHQVAMLLNISVATIRRRRLLRQPPDFVKIGACVRYQRVAVDRLIKSGERTAEAR